MLLRVPAESGVQVPPRTPSLCSSDACSSLQRCAVTLFDTCHQLPSLILVEDRPLEDSHRQARYLPPHPLDKRLVVPFTDRPAKVVQDRRVSVAEVVKPDHWEPLGAERLPAPADLGDELPGDVLRVAWPPSMSPNTSASSRASCRPSSRGASASRAARPRSRGRTTTCQPSFHVPDARGCRRPGHDASWR